MQVSFEDNKSFEDWSVINGCIDNVAHFLTAEWECSLAIFTYNCSRYDNKLTAHKYFTYSSAVLPLKIEFNADSAKPDGEEGRKNTIEW